MKARRKPQQLSLPLKTWGGARKGAGRKPKEEKAGVSHRTRPVVTKHSPVHVTMRIAAGLPNLRRGAYPAVVTSALAKSRVGAGNTFRLVHYSVQSNHLHLICEADSSTSLALGMKSLATRVARAVNRERGKPGKVFADRYHTHVLKTPREVRNTLLYVLNNSRKHGALPARTKFDVLSSAEAFNGWRNHRPSQAAPSASSRESGTAATSIIVPARSWLLTIGWRRHGLLDPFAIPKPYT